MRIYLVVVCYNSYKDALDYLLSLEVAYAYVSDMIDITVTFSDNSDQTDSVNLVRSHNFNFNFNYIKNTNIGYFPAFHKAICEVNILDYQYVIISNVDLIMAEDFFINLLKLKPNNQIGLLAPAILSKTLPEMDENPKIYRRPSIKRTIAMCLITSHSYIFSLYRVYSKYLKKYFSKKSEADLYKHESMYAAHGAFMIFTQEYFRRGASVNYPRKLFGEEGFVAENMLKKQLQISHEKSLIIHDKKHGATSLMSSKDVTKENHKSYLYFLGLQLTNGK